MGPLAQVAVQGQGRCWVLVVTPCNSDLSLCFSVSWQGRAQLPARSSCSRHCPGSCLGTDMCSLLCGFWFGFLFFFAHVFFFFPTISPVRLPFMPQLHAPVCKLVGRVGASPYSLAGAGLVVRGGRAWFRSTHSGLIHASVSPLPSSMAGEDELGQHNMASACSSLGTDLPWWCTPLANDTGFPSCWGHWWPCPRPPGLHRSLQARWRLVLPFLLACLVEQNVLAPVTQSCTIAQGLGLALALTPSSGPCLGPSWLGQAGCGTRASRPARCHALTLSPNRGMATSVGSITPAGCWPIPCCTCPLFLPEAHLHQSLPIAALLTALTYL